MSRQTVNAVMTSTFVSIDPDDPITDAAKAMRDATIGSLMVVDVDNRPEGILTRSDFVDFVADHPELAIESVPSARELMTTDLITIGPDATLEAAATVMAEHDIHHLPVVTEDDRVVGIVTTSDLAHVVRHESDADR